MKEFEDKLPIPSPKSEEPPQNSYKNLPQPTLEQD